MVAAMVALDQVARVSLTSLRQEILSKATPLSLFILLFLHREKKESISKCRQTWITERKNNMRKVKAKETLSLIAAIIKVVQGLLKKKPISSPT